MKAGEIRGCGVQRDASYTSCKEIFFSSSEIMNIDKMRLQLDLYMYVERGKKRGVSDILSDCGKCDTRK